MSEHGLIVKALSGFYYVEAAGKTVECRARGRFRREGLSPLVGDNVSFSITSGEKGIIDSIDPRRNAFVRPPVANIDAVVMIASAATPVTDPFLVDRVSAIAHHNNCEMIVVINKSDLNPGDELFRIYSSSGFTTIRTSAATGEGIDLLSEATAGKICVFTGNSGVGKSSILNALGHDLSIEVGEVSEKLGRGRHTTRHVELFKLSNGAVIADTPGFSSFDTEQMDLIKKEELQYSFPDFEPYFGNCRFTNCAHIKESGCAVLDALKDGKIEKTRHESYVRLYEQAKQIKEWDIH